MFFTTATIIASAIMYRGWHTANAVNTVSLICGFIIIFSGVYLLDSIARKSRGSVVLPPMASASSLHRYDSKSNMSARTTSVVETGIKHHLNTKLDRWESSASRPSCRRMHRALSV